MRAEISVHGHRVISLEARFPGRCALPPPDALTAARDLIAAWEALSGRDRDCQSRTYADLFCDALGTLAASCTPLREEAARRLAEIMRRAEYGDGPARAMAHQDRHLRAVGREPS